MTTVTAVAILAVCLVCGYFVGTLMAASRMPGRRSGTPAPGRSLAVLGLSGVPATQVMSGTHVHSVQTRKMLACNENLQPELVPDPARFREQLDLLLQLNALNTHAHV